MPAKLALYSDFHLGGPEGMSFRQDEKKFVSHIEKRKKEGHIIVFLGDVFDLYETKVCCDSRDLKFQRIIEEYPLIYNLIKNGDVHFVTGNHDDYNIKNSSQDLTFNMNKRTIRLEHGHKYDNNLNCQCCCECFWCPKGYRCFGSFLNFFNCSQKVKDEEYPQIGLRILDEKKEVDILVFGHTHQPMVINKEGRYYVNTGCVCGPDSFDETIIDVETEIKITQNKIKL